MSDVQERLYIILINVDMGGVHVVQYLADAADILDHQVEHIILLTGRVLEQRPEIGAESSQDVFVGFEADPLHHQHAVTEKPLNPLLLELLEEVGAVAGQGVHGQPAAQTFIGMIGHSTTL